MTQPLDKSEEINEALNPECCRRLENVLDQQSLRILKSLDLQSFDCLDNAFEHFLQDAPLFQGDITFGIAALCLDLTAQLFAEIDSRRDHLFNKGDLQFMLEKTTADNREALNWLIQHFDAFSQACFFANGVTRDDIESARNVFHGLKLVHEKFGFNEEATPENLLHLHPDALQAFLDKNRKSLEPHDEAGLQELLNFIRQSNG